jgi:hypothetical protein
MPTVERLDAVCGLIDSLVPRVAVMPRTMGSMSQRRGGSTPKALQTFCRQPYVFDSE